MRARNPGVALVLSAIFPGLGQFYNRQFGKGVAFFVAGLVSSLVTSALLPSMDALLGSKGVKSFVDKYFSGERREGVYEGAGRTGEARSCSVYGQGVSGLTAREKVPDTFREVTR